MHNRTAVPKEERPPVPAFTPVVELEERGGFVPGEANWTDAGGARSRPRWWSEEKLAAGKALPAPAAGRKGKKRD